MKLLQKLWTDERGAIVSIEILVIATILVIALMAAWVVVRNAVILQINDQAHWISGEEFEEEYHGIELGEIVTCSDIFDAGES